MPAVVRTVDKSLPYLDAAIDQIRDEFGIKKYRSGADVVNDAVRKLETPFSTMDTAGLTTTSLHERGVEIWR